VSPGAASSHKGGASGVLIPSWKLVCPRHVPLLHHCSVSLGAALCPPVPHRVIKEEPVVYSSCPANWCVPATSPATSHSVPLVFSVVEMSGEFWLPNLVCPPLAPALNQRLVLTMSTTDAPFPNAASSVYVPTFSKDLMTRPRSPIHAPRFR
jgi:hypothetical protein